MAKSRDTRKLAKKLESMFDKYFGDLDKKDRDALLAHVRRGRAGIEEGEWDEWKKFGKESVRESFTTPAQAIRRLEDIIAEAPRTPEDITVFRGGPESVAERSRRYRYPISTTLDEDTAFDFATDWDDGARIDEIFVPEGSPHLYPTSLYPDTKFDSSQSEVLLPQSKFELTERRRPRRFDELQEEADTQEEFEALWKLMNKYRYKPPYRRGGLVTHRRSQ